MRRITSYLPYALLLLIIIWTTFQNFDWVKANPWTYLILLALALGFLAYLAISERKSRHESLSLSTSVTELHNFCESVERITGFPAYTSSGSCFLLFFFRDRSERDIDVPCTTLAKIAKTGLNQWSISRDFIDIRPGDGQPLRIAYTPTGEYATFSAYWLFRSSYGVAGLAAFLLGFGINKLWYYTALAPRYPGPPLPGRRVLSALIRHHLARRHNNPAPRRPRNLLALQRHNQSRKSLAPHKGYHRRRPDYPLSPRLLVASRTD